MTRTKSEKREKVSLVELEASLREVNSRIAAHIKKEHKEGLSPSCHECNRLAQSKRTIESHIWALRK